MVKVKTRRISVFSCDACEYTCNLNVKLKMHKRKTHTQETNILLDGDSASLLKQLVDQNLRMLKEIKGMKKEFRNTFEKLKVTVENGTKTLIKDTNEKCEPPVGTVLDITKRLKKLAINCHRMFSNQSSRLKLH